VPGVPWVIGIGLVLSNTGVIPSEAPAFGFVGQYLLPLGIPFLLFKANLRSVFADGGWVLPAFIISSIGVCLGAITGFFMFDLGPEGAEIAGTYAAAFVGGVVNFVAVSQAVEMSPTQFSVALSASAPVSVLGLIVLATLPSMPFIRRHFPSDIIDRAEVVAVSGVDESAPRFRADHVALGIAMSFAICSLSAFVSAKLGMSNYNLFFITVFTVILANIAPRQLEPAGRFCGGHAVHVRILCHDRRWYRRHRLYPFGADSVRLLRLCHRHAVRHSLDWRQAVPARFRRGGDRCSGGHRWPGRSGRAGNHEGLENDDHARYRHRYSGLCRGQFRRNRHRQVA